MSVRFSRPEYWLIESVVDFKYPVGLILDAKLPLVLNRRRHGLSRDAVRAALHELLSRGFIRLSRQRDSETVLELSDAELSAALDESLPKIDSPERANYYTDSVQFGLTPLGGAAWEEFAAPDWDWYIQHYCRHDGDDEARCCNRKRLEGFLRSCAAAFGEIDPSSIQWTSIGPWEATYWKTLPGGFHVDFRFIADFRFTPQDRTASDLTQLKRHQLTEAGFFYERDGFYEWR